jgi:hypothetical protein
MENRIELTHMKSRHSNLLQENCDLKEEIAGLRKKHDKELENLRK